MIRAGWPRPMGKRSVRPWHSPAGHRVRCAQTTDLCALRPLTTSARPGHHGSADRLRVVSAVQGSPPVFSEFRHPTTEHSLSQILSVPSPSLHSSKSAVATGWSPPRRTSRSTSAPASPARTASRGSSSTPTRTAPPSCCRRPHACSTMARCRHGSTWFDPRLARRWPERSSTPRTGATPLKPSGVRSGSTRSPNCPRTGNRASGSLPACCFPSGTGCRSRTCACTSSPPTMAKPS